MLGPTICMFHIISPMLCHVHELTYCLVHKDLSSTVKQHLKTMSIPFLRLLDRALSVADFNRMIPGNKHIRDSYPTKVAEGSRSACELSNKLCYSSNDNIVNNLPSGLNATTTASNSNTNPLANVCGLPMYSLERPECCKNRYFCEGQDSCRKILTFQRCWHPWMRYWSPDNFTSRQTCL